MNLNNPYIVSIATGLSVYLFTYNSNEKNDKNSKQRKQTNLNYVFLSSIIVFLIMNFYGSNNSSLEPTLDCKFDD